jgi:hypothetical protein
VITPAIAPLITSVTSIACVGGVRFPVLVAYDFMPSTCFGGVYLPVLVAYGFLRLTCFGGVFFFGL